MHRQTNCQRPAATSFKDKATIPFWVHQNPSTSATASEHLAVLGEKLKPAGITSAACSVGTLAEARQTSCDVKKTMSHMLPLTRLAARHVNRCNAVTCRAVDDIEPWILLSR